MTPWKRIFVDHRALVSIIAIGLLANVAVYAVAVRPLGVKSAGAADRARAAAASVREAEREYAAARALVVGKTRADQELSTFYDRVLPPDQFSAVRLTYVPLPEIARKANVRVLARRWQPDAPKKDARLGRLHISAALQGEYEGFRRFIYELESAPQFVIIDDVTLTQGEPGKSLTLTLELSTYYLLGGHGD
jgi:type II secretion system (T2SS) protein M